MGGTAADLLDLVAQMEEFAILPNTASFNLVLKAMYEAKETEAKEKLLQRLPFCSVEEIKVLAWLESFEVQDWISCVGGTSQDAMTSHIIVATALSIWYPSLVKPTLLQAATLLQSSGNIVVTQQQSFLQIEGMESTWMMCIGSEIHRLIRDIFFQIECKSGPSPNSIGEHHAVPASIRETLETLL
ncbi:hypothetical protein Q3G72_003795 [Acer saccharum]|nr:hypothetical protein Q3G72_003795 [Acer saccharum]